VAEGVSWPIYLVNLALLGLSLAIGSSDAESAAGLDLRAPVPVREIASPEMIVVLARYLADREQRWTP